ncbi:aspartic peptidase domain-containing protein [Aspergillus keveii]|uniref:Aspartic peptidase domain-containing protein n=1 Tax=Aspergillus keveii TaxID=714993 RepID=A0ABR4FY14_9EURO
MHLGYFMTSQLLVSALAGQLPSRALHTVGTTNRSNSTTARLHANLYGLRYHVPVTVGTQVLPLAIDTGSSDLFVVERGFTCVDKNLARTSQSSCGYGNITYSSGDSDRAVSGEVFEASYAAGAVRGPIVYENITLAGVPITNQKIALVNWSTPLNIGSAGVLGLAFPPVTKAYELNTTLQQDTKPQGTQQPYNPVVINMYEQHLVEPYISLAMNRLPRNQSEGDGGYLTLGGLPLVDVTSNFTTVPLEYLDGALVVSQRIDYVDHGHMQMPYQTIVDSGGPYLRLPKDTAEEYNQGFEPAGKWDADTGFYEVQCDAVPPRLSLTIGNHSFTHNPADLISRDDEGRCFSVVVPASTTGILSRSIGVPFLKNVVAVFDYGQSDWLQK